MGLLDIVLCPNPKCEQKTLKLGEKCPKCGSPSQKFEASEGGTLLKQKKFHQQTKQGTPPKELLISDEMTEEEISQKISEDMMNLAMHEAGTGWMRLGTLLSGNSTDQILGAGLKALIDQNKIIIRQNELILRTLKKTQMSKLLKA